MFKNNIFTTGIVVTLCGASFATQATEWTQTIDAETYGGSTGTITFDDWGFSDGLNGRNATQFDAINGFGEVGQIQHVVTRDADWATPDAAYTAKADLGGSNTYTNANMDAGVNFYQWAYTTTGGSTFNNMKIDKDGDYFVAQEDMSFNLYDSFNYQQVGNDLQPGDAGYLADGIYPTAIAFQPYVLSDAKGWCGSVMASNPGSLEAMAGQITFDFAFDVYFQFNGTYIYSSTEIVRNFEMRSYGTIDVNVATGGGELQTYSASAVVNNTNPNINNTTVDGAPVDLDYYNQVSFMGAGAINSTNYCGQLSSDWTGGVVSDTSTYKYTGIIDGATNPSACAAAGGEWQINAYAGRAFILRADGTRVIEGMDYSEYGDLSNVPYVDENGVAYNYDENGVLVPIANLAASVVPVPAAVWLFASGLLGLIGVARRKTT